MFNDSVGLLATNDDLKVIQLQGMSINILRAYPISFIKKIEITNELNLVFVVSDLKVQFISSNNLMERITNIGRYNASSIINDIAVSVSLNQLFIATNNGLEVVDIFNTSNPVLIGFYETKDPVLSVKANGTTIFIAAGKSGFQVLNCGYNWAITANPAISDIGNYNLTLTATDVFGAKVNNDFSILVMGSPTLTKNVSNRIVYVNKLLDFSIPLDTFNDANSNLLTYSAALANYNKITRLPEWLSFDASAIRFYGIPSLSDAYFYVDKILNINLTAMNSGPIGASVIFNISVRGIEKPPQIINNISNQIAYVGKPFDFKLPNNIFNDSYTLSYAAALANNAGALPEWLTFDASTLRFYGTPTMGDLGILGDKNLKINTTAVNPGPIGSSIIYNLTITGMPYGVMASIIAGSILASGIIGFTAYRKAPVMVYAWHKITTRTKCWQFDGRPLLNKERKQKVYFMSEEYFARQKPEYLAQRCTPGMVHDQYGVATNVILNKDSSLLTVTLKKDEQELLPRKIIKNNSKSTEKTLKVGNSTLNLIAAKGEYHCSQEYQLIKAASGSKDFKKVLESYQHHPVPGYDIKSVEIIYNPIMELTFAENLKMLQARSNNPAFIPRFLQEETSPEYKELRINTNALWKNMTANYADSHCPDVKLLPLWHGTKPEILHSIFKAGYANLATTDCGYFGKGLYSTFEAEYSYKYYYQGALILNWVSSYSAYPVIAGDMHKLTAKGTYQNYDTNFIPVVPYTANNKDNFVPTNLDAVDDVYLPCDVGQEPLYTEVVVFERAQCLPRYLVTLQPILARIIYNLGTEEERIRRLLRRQEAMSPVNSDSGRSVSHTSLSQINKFKVLEDSFTSNSFLPDLNPIEDASSSRLLFSASPRRRAEDVRQETLAIDLNDKSQISRPLLFSSPQVANLQSSNTVEGCSEATTTKFVRMSKI